MKIKTLKDFRDFISSISEPDDYVVAIDFGSEWQDITEAFISVVDKKDNPDGGAITIHINQED